MQSRDRVSSWAGDVVVDRLCVSRAYLDDKGFLGIALVVSYVYIDNPLVHCHRRLGASCRLALSSKDILHPLTSGPLCIPIGQAMPQEHVEIILRIFYRVYRINETSSIVLQTNFDTANESVASRGQIWYLEQLANPSLYDLSLFRS